MKITLNKIELLQKARENVNLISTAIDEILSGEPISVTLRRYNISRIKFENFINNGLKENNRASDKPALGVNDIDNILLTPEERVYKEVFGSFSYPNLPVDLQETLNYIYDYYLDEPMRKMIELMYYRCCTMAEAASNMRISDAELMSIYKKVMRKLRRPAIVLLLKLGIREYDRQRKIRSKLCKQNSEETKKRFNIEYGLAVSEKDIEWLKNMRERIDLVLESRSFVTIKNETVAVNQLSPTVPKYKKSLYVTRELAVEALAFDYLHSKGVISTRTKNALCRAGYFSVGDLDGVSIESLYQARNIGNLVMKELLGYLRTLTFVSVPDKPNEKIRVNLKVKKVATIENLDGT